MGRVVFAFATTHWAMTAEDALREAGIPMQVIPLPGWIESGCGLAVRMDAAQRTRAEDELRRRGVSLKGVYEEPREPEGYR